MTILLAAHPEASALMPLSERLWTFGPLIVAAIVVALLTLPWARKRYRLSRRQWPLARLVWIMAGVGMELLTGGAIAIGIYGVLGFENLPAKIFLVIATVCGAMGILVICLSITVGSIASIARIIAYIRYGGEGRDKG